MPNEDSGDFRTGQTVADWLLIVSPLQAGVAFTGLHIAQVVGYIPQNSVKRRVQLKNSTKTVMGWLYGFYLG
jgi:hypothetical protein